MLRHEQLRSKGMNTNGFLHHVAVIHTRNLLDDFQHFAQETEAFLPIVTRPGDPPGHLCRVSRKTALKKGRWISGANTGEPSSLFFVNRETSLRLRQSRLGCLLIKRFDLFRFDR